MKLFYLSILLSLTILINVKGQESIKFADFELLSNQIQGKEYFDSIYNKTKAKLNKEGQNLINSLVEEEPMTPGKRRLTKNEIKLEEEKIKNQQKIILEFEKRMKEKLSNLEEHFKDFKTNKVMSIIKEYQFRKEIDLVINTKNLLFYKEKNLINQQIILLINKTSEKEIINELRNLFEEIIK